MKIPDNYIQLGRLGKTFQLQGGLRFYGLGEAEEEALLSLKRVFVRGVGEADIREVRELGGGLVVYLTKALTVEAAKRLTNLEVYAPRASLSETEDDNLYLDEVVGLEVWLDGQSFGTVKEIREAGLQDLLLIKSKQGEVILPFPSPYVRVEEDGVYLENVPEGLLDLNQ
ncbi:MAG: ribosome maturation factor RimM [Trueperaceae bacterium]